MPSNLLTALFRMALHSRFATHTSDKHQNIAEVFGIVAGAIGIASALSACIDGIGSIQIGRHLGSDFQTFQLRLRMLELRLTRWGEAVRVYEDAQFSNPSATTDEIRVAKNTLFQILDLLQRSDKLSQKFQPPFDQNEERCATDTVHLGRNFFALDKKIRDIIERRKHNKAGRVKIAHWVLYSKEHATQLISEITSLIDLLHQLFPMPEKELALARDEARQLISAIVDQQSTIQYLQQLVQGIDSDFRKALDSHATHGHRYGDQSVADNARIQNGHTVTRAWEGITGSLPVGPGMTFAYQRAEGSSRVRNGDVYVDKDDFWS
ncbi:hypothetical protein F4819DRAFT_458848 [Hypoxylon fuscum]|nr:hypothetical protein F4819DRAFT_458848 [Hypoxylon fuscum]